MNDQIIKYVSEINGYIIKDKNKVPYINLETGEDQINSMNEFKTWLLTDNAPTGVFIAHVFINSNDTTAIVEKLNNDYLSFIHFGYEFVLTQYEYAEGIWNTSSMIKSIITISTNSEQNITASTLGTQILLPNTEAVTGDKLTRENNNVIIGSGVHHILVSGEVSGITQGRAWLEVIIQREGLTINDCGSIGWSGDDYYHTWSVVPKLVSVQEGDIVTMVITSKEDITLNPTSMGNNRTGYLTVEVID